MSATIDIAGVAVQLLGYYRTQRWMHSDVIYPLRKVIEIYGEDNGRELLSYWSGIPTVDINIVSWHSWTLKCCRYVGDGDYPQQWLSAMAGSTIKSTDRACAYAVEVYDHNTKGQYLIIATPVDRSFTQHSVLYKNSLFSHLVMYKNLSGKAQISEITSISMEDTRLNVAKYNFHGAEKVTFCVAKRWMNIHGEVDLDGRYRYWMISAHVPTRDRDLFYNSNFSDIIYEAEKARISAAVATRRVRKLYDQMAKEFRAAGRTIQTYVMLLPTRQIQMAFVPDDRVRPRYRFCAYNWSEYAERSPVIGLYRLGTGEESWVALSEGHMPESM